MRIPLVKVWLVFVLSALLGGCLESDQPLIAGSAFSDAYAGTYTISDGAAPVAEAREDRLIRLRKSGADLVREDYDEASKGWKPGNERLRFAPYQGGKKEAIVQISDGKSHAYLFYQSQKADKALLWKIDCSKLAKATRDELKIMGDGKLCKVTRLAQVEGAIRAYMLTNPKPDYRIAKREENSLKNALSPLLKSATGLNTGDIIKRIKSISPSLTKESSEEEADPNSFGNRATMPVSETWTKLRQGDFSGAWRTIWHSWIIFALIAFLIGIVITRRC